jgi:hypothetical protein
VAESPVQRILSDTKLLVQSAWTYDRNSGRLAVYCPALPHQPHVEIEDTRRVCKCRNYFALDGNSMPVDLVIEGFTERDHIFLALLITILFARIEPELHLIKKVTGEKNGIKTLKMTTFVRYKAAFCLGIFGLPEDSNSRCD